MQEILMRDTTRVVALDVNLWNFHRTLPVIEIIRRVAGHLVVVVRGDRNILWRFITATQLGMEESTGRDCGYDILSEFICLSWRWHSEAKGGLVRNAKTQ